VVYVIFRSYRLYLGRLESEKCHAEEMAALHLRTIEALALAIEAKDHTTHDHLQRVQIYALELGKKMQLDDHQLQALRAASILHDIGKLAVPEHIISKPGKLTSEEFDKMKIHPVVGAEILARVQFPYDVVPIVRAHHERWNGTGYPDGLKGEEIPIGAGSAAAPRIARRKNPRPNSILRTRPDDLRRWHPSPDSRPGHRPGSPKPDVRIESGAAHRDPLAGSLARPPFRIVAVRQGANP
jgi:putative nucleotidyltransferase with HDIG domain